MNKYKVVDSMGNVIASNLSYGEAQAIQRNNMMKRFTEGQAQTLDYTIKEDY